MFSGGKARHSATWQDQSASPKPTWPSEASVSPWALPGTPPGTARTPPPARTGPAVQEGMARPEQEPIRVCHLPQVLREDREEALSNLEIEDFEEINGSIDSATGIAWVLFGSKLYTWNYLSSPNPRHCTVLKFPGSLTKADTGGSIIAVHWFVKIIAPSSDVSDTISNGFGSFAASFSSPIRQESFAFATSPTVGSEGRDSKETPRGKSEGQANCSSMGRNVGVVAIHKRTMAVVYWPDIAKEEGGGAVLGRVNEEWTIPHGSGLRPSGSFGSRVRHSDCVTAVIAICRRAGESETEGDLNMSSGSKGVVPEGENERLSPTNGLVEGGLTNGRLTAGNEVVGDEPIGCILVVGCNSGELWRIDCSPYGIKRVRLGRETADYSNSRSATFGMLAFERSSEAPATIRSIVLLPENSALPSVISDSDLMMTKSNEKQEGEREGSGVSGLALFSGFRQKSKQRKQQQVQQVQQEERERKEKEKLQEAAEDMEKGGKSMCRFLLLTAAGLEAWTLKMEPGGKASLAWAYDILGDKAVHMDLAGQKQVWLLDLALAAEGDSVIVLLASLCKDRAAVGGSQTQYWLLSFILPPKSSLQPLTKPLTQPSQRPLSPPPSPPTSRPSTPSIRPLSSSRLVANNSSPSSPSRDNAISPAFKLERKWPARVFVPKARVENEENLLLLKLHIGGRPNGSALILASDGTATVTFFDKGEPWLYQTDPSCSLGKVLGVGFLPRRAQNDEGLHAAVSVGADGFPLSEFPGSSQLKEKERETEREEVGGEWVLLTEREGVWALSEQMILDMAVEPFGRPHSIHRQSHKKVFGVLESGKEEGEGEGEGEETIGLTPRKSPRLAIPPSRIVGGGPIEGEEREGFLQDETNEGRGYRNARSGTGGAIALTTTTTTTLQRQGEAETLVERVLGEAAGERMQESLKWLREVGAFEVEGRENILAQASRAIIDTLPKHWGGGHMWEGQLAAVSVQLGEKERRHNQYLEFLSRSGCHQELLLLQKSALTAIMEDGEKLAASISLRESHNQQANQIMPRGSPLQLTTTKSVPSVLWEAIQLAGGTIRRSNVLLMGKEEGEVFFTRVSQISELFAAVQLHAGAVIGREPYPQQQAANEDSPAVNRELSLPLNVQVERFCQLSAALKGAVAAAKEYRERHSVWYPLSEGEEEEGGGGGGGGGGRGGGGGGGWEGRQEPWLCSGPLRRGLRKLANLCTELRAEAAQFQHSLVPSLSSIFRPLSHLLLDLFAEALDERERRGEPFQGLAGEYGKLKDELLKEMVSHAREEALRSAQISGDKSQIRVNLMAQYNEVVSIARRHCAYEAMLTMCEELEAWDVLRTLMREPMGRGGEGRFCTHVFQRCYERGHYGFLLSFGKDLPEEVEAFLQDYKSLRWLHELYLGQYGKAAATLRQQALTNDGRSGRGGEGGREGSGEGEGKTGLSFGERRQLLSLSKLAVLVEGGGEEREGERKRTVDKLDACMELLQIQEMAAKEGLLGSDAVGAAKLAEACLKGSRSLVLRAFEVFAFGGSEMRKSSKVLLEQAWLQAVDLDPWISLKQRSKEEGWSEEQYWDVLRGTGLFHAAKRCFGKNSVRIGEPFEAVLPLFSGDRRGVWEEMERERERESEREREGGELRGGEAAEGLGDSVQTLLSRHIAYPEAGQAMAAALQMGRDDEDLRGSEF